MAGSLRVLVYPWPMSAEGTDRDCPAGRAAGGHGSHAAPRPTGRDGRGRRCRARPLPVPPGRRWWLARRRAHARPSVHGCLPAGPAGGREAAAAVPDVRSRDLRDVRRPRLPSGRAAYRAGREPRTRPMPRTTPGRARARAVRDPRLLAAFGPVHRPGGARHPPAPWRSPGSWRRASVRRPGGSPAAIAIPSASPGASTHGRDAIRRRLARPPPSASPADAVPSPEITLVPTEVTPPPSTTPTTYTVKRGDTLSGIAAGLRDDVAGPRRTQRHQGSVCACGPAPFCSCPDRARCAAGSTRSSAGSHGSTT